MTRGEHCAKTVEKRGRPPPGNSMNDVNSGKGREKRLLHRIINTYEAMRGGHCPAVNGAVPVFVVLGCLRNGCDGGAGVDFKEVVEVVSKVIDGAGVFLIIAGITIATVSFIRRWLKRDSSMAHEAYKMYRAGIGRSILLGLEILIAGDIIRTVAIDLTYQSLGTLAVLVLIRSFLSVNLEMEIEGRWPWQRKQEPLPGSSEPIEPSPAREQR